MDKTYELFQEMFAVADDIVDITDAMGLNYVDAVEEYDTLSNKDYFAEYEDDDEDILMHDMECYLDQSREYLLDVRDNLDEFDLRLKQLIALRKRLGDEIDVPLDLGNK
jgi:hypothetical protein